MAFLLQRSAGALHLLWQTWLPPAKGAMQSRQRFQLSLRTPWRSESPQLPKEPPKQALHFCPHPTRPLFNTQSPFVLGLAFLSKQTRLIFVQGVKPLPKAGRRCDWEFPVQPHARMEKKDKKAKTTLTVSILTSTHVFLLTSVISLYQM